MEDARTLWCGNLPENVTEQLLYELFIQAGPIENIILPRETKKKFYFAFILYKHEEAVPYAVKLFEDLTLYGRNIYVRTRNNFTPNKDGDDVYNKSPVVQTLTKFGCRMFYGDYSPVVQKEIHQNSSSFSQDEMNSSLYSQDEMNSSPYSQNEMNSLPFSQADIDSPSKSIIPPLIAPYGTTPDYISLVSNPLLWPQNNFTPWSVHHAKKSILPNQMITDLHNLSPYGLNEFNNSSKKLQSRRKWNARYFNESDDECVNDNGKGFNRNEGKKKNKNKKRRQDNKNEEDEEVVTAKKIAKFDMSSENDSKYKISEQKFGKKTNKRHTNKHKQTNRNSV